MDNKEIVRYFYEIVVSENLLEQPPPIHIRELYSQSRRKNHSTRFRWHEATSFRCEKTYPDYTMTIIQQYVDGDYVISEFIMEGTHEGEWIGIKPTHKRLSFTGVDIDKVVNGKIVEHGGAVNTFDTLFEQHLIKPV